MKIENTHKKSQQFTFRLFYPTSYVEEQISVCFESIIKRFCNQFTGLGKKSIGYFQKN